YYDRPDWLRGNAWEYLEKQGNFSLFLQAIERADYKDMLNGRSLCTVMAPTDEAFRKYLEKLGVASVADISVKDLKVLMGYHLVKNAYEKEYMLEFIMDPNNEKPNSGEDKAYKFETNAQLMYRETVNPNTGRKIKIKPETKYLPVMSSRLFPKLNLDNPEDNYRYFFPDVKWQGTDEQLYAQGAAVTEAGIATDNGYVYVLDAVCEPLRTIYEAVQAPKKDEFSTFLKLYDKFAEVFYTSMNDEGDSLFTFDHYHIRHGRESSKITRAKTTQYADELPSLASESAYHNERYGARPDYFMNMTYCYNAFVPNNNALNTYFQNFFEGFASIDDVPQLTLYYLFQPIGREEQDIILPEMFERDGQKGIYGEKWMITRDNVVNAEFCANGILYGLNTVLEPLLFHGICKPMFSTPDFSIMANVFFKADEFVTLADDTEDRYSLLILADSTLESEQYNMTLDYGNSYFNDANEVVKKNMEKMSNDDIQTLGDKHIVNGAIRDFSKVRYFATRNAFTYVYTGKNAAGEDCLYDCGGNQLNIINKWDENQGISNGVTFQIDQIVSTASLTLAEQLSAHFPKFLDLLRTADLAKVADNGKVT
ncbi:MAG: fasciclin domain-containing protein, partial [Odoribacter sp.]|nr:fasciclin domain-containing protein [Odoribacter sp.]